MILRGFDRAHGCFAIVQLLSHVQPPYGMFYRLVLGDFLRYRTSCDHHILNEDLYLAVLSGINIVLAFPESQLQPTIIPGMVF